MSHAFSWCVAGYVGTVSQKKSWVCYFKTWVREANIRDGECNRLANSRVSNRGPGHSMGQPRFSAPTQLILLVTVEVGGRHLTSKMQGPELQPKSPVFLPFQKTQHVSFGCQRR